MTKIQHIDKRMSLLIVLINSKFEVHLPYREHHLPLPLSKSPSASGQFRQSFEMLS